MVVKKPAAETEVEPAAETRKCNCGPHADIVDGLCRRCRLAEAKKAKKS